MAEPPSPPPAAQSAAQQPQKQRSCFFCCLGLVIALAIVGTAAAAVGVYFWHAITEVLRDELSSAEPLEVPATELAEAERDALYERLNAFQNAVEGGAGPKELTLSQRELNYLLQHAQQFQELGKLHATLKDGAIALEASLSLDTFPGAALFGLEGRYLNGNATLDVGIRNGRPAIFITEFSRPEGEIPGPMLQRLRTVNFADMLAQDPALRAAMDAAAEVEVSEEALRVRLPDT